MILKIYNENIEENVECKAYSSKNHFVTNKCLGVKNEETIGYVPLDYLSDEYDSSLRCNIDNDKEEYQICTSLPVNVINKYFPGGNLLIPLNSYEELYNLLVGLFGVFRVKMVDDGILFKAPSVISGFTKIFMTGLNVTVSFNDYRLATYYNGYSDKIIKKDNLQSRSMVVKMLPGHEYLFTFNDTFMSLGYNDELVKNFMIIGYDVERLNDQKGSYRPLLISENYFLYDKDRHCIYRVDKTSKKIVYVNFVKTNYLNKKNLAYNYYLLKTPIPFE